jgi:hypothetical protein
MRIGIAALTALAVSLSLSGSAAAHLFPHGGVVLSGRLRPGDVDRFTFRLSEGEILTASLYDGESGEFNDALLGVFSPGPTPTLFARSDDDGPGFMPRLAVRADERGLWTVAVTGFGDDAFTGAGHTQDFSYQLVVAIADSPPRLIEREDRGGNDTVRSADRVPLAGGAAIVSGELVPGDVDVFEVWVPPGSTLTASVFDDARGEFNDSLLRLRDSDGTVLAEDDDGGPGFLSNLAYEVPEAETRRRVRAPVPIYVELTGFDPVGSDARPHRESFSYQLVVSTDRGPRPLRPLGLDLLGDAARATADGLLDADLLQWGVEGAGGGLSRRGSAAP